MKKKCSCFYTADSTGMVRDKNDQFHMIVVGPLMTNVPTKVMVNSFLACVLKHLFKSKENKNYRSCFPSVSPQFDSLL